MHTINKSGFTLIELLVVVAIIGLLSSIILNSINNVRAKARDARKLADAREFITAMQIYYSNNGNFPDPPGNSYWTSASTSSIYSWQKLEETLGQKLQFPPDGAAPGTNGIPYYEYYKSWWIGSIGPENCKGRRILRIVPGMETRPQIRECNEQYAFQGSTFLIQ